MKKWRFIISAVIVGLEWIQLSVHMEAYCDLLAQNVQSQRNQIKYSPLLKSNLLKAVWQLS